MSRQHAQPHLLLDNRPLALTPLSLKNGSGQMSEAQLQDFVHNNPQCLPIAEIDPIYAGPVPLCREMRTNAGAIDNFMITPSGLPVLIECKLWRNPEGRREVVGQILDYAKELSRWTASDLQREVARRVEREGNPVLALLREAGHEIDEIAFNDALTHNLKRGRFLLLIIGDGIREGVETIAEYLQAHAGLHFSLGLVEMPIYDADGGLRLIVPRVLARTQLITRTVVEIPEGQKVLDDAEQSAAEEEASDPLSRINFWTEFVSGLHFDDPEQPKPRAGNQGYVSLPLPVAAGSTWITVYRSEARWEVGVYLSYHRNTAGADIVAVLVEERDDILEELGGTATLYTDKYDRQIIEDHLRTGPWTDPANKAKALAWLRERSNDFVNVLRPRVKSVAADMRGEN